MAAAATPSQSLASCQAKPLPDGCVTRVKFVDPSSFQTAVAPDGSASGTWSPSLAAPGPVEELDQPMPIAQVATQAASEAVARGYAYGRGHQPVATGSSLRNARSSDYVALCTYDPRRPLMVSVSSGYYHMHARSYQTCNGVSSHSVITSLYRGSSDRADDGVDGGNGQRINTDAWAGCVYFANQVYTWWNWSDFWAHGPDGTFFQGPSGYFNPIDHHCT
jgi:hypothetical protein